MRYHNSTLRRGKRIEIINRKRQDNALFKILFTITENPIVSALDRLMKEVKQDD